MTDAGFEHALRAAVEHTLLAAAARPDEIDRLCSEAVAQRFGGVCVNPVYVARCRERLAGSAVRVVSVVGFPLGASASRTKAFETELAVADGADEIDTVMRLGAARAGDWNTVEADVRAVVEAAQGRAVKLILETAVLSDAEKERACAVALRAGAAFVKTSTGYGAGGATVEDVRLLRRVVGDRAGVKASGGIRSLAQARALLAAGADRLGTSSGVQIAAELFAG